MIIQKNGIKKTMNTIKEIKDKIKQNGSISSKEYRELMMQSPSHSIKKEKINRLNEVSYSYNVLFISEDEIEATLIGKNFSVNVIKTFSRKEEMLYKKKIHDSAYLFFLQNKKIFSSFQPFSKASVFYTAYYPKSRDCGNNDYKALQDTFVRLGLIVDDKRSVLKRDGEREIISKEYKIVATIKKHQALKI